MLEIIYEDNHLIALNKPAGLLTQPTDTNAPNLESQVKEYIKTTYQKPGNVYLHAVHRLDRPVSGIVLFAKSAKALSRLNEAMRNQEIEKEYLAICEGQFTDSKATIEHYLFHDDYKAKVVSPHEKDAKKSTLTYEVLNSKNNLTLLKIILHSGRYHQIRAQLAAIGHPIVGDHKYGGTHFPNDVILLHHYRMKCMHPVQKNILTLEILPPAFWPMTIN